MPGTEPSAGPARMLDPELVDLLVCPVDHARLRLEAEALVCTVCGRRYPVEEGIPNMLVEER